MPEQKVVIDVGDGAAIPTKKDHGLLSAWRPSHESKAFAHFHDELLQVADDAAF